MREDARMHVSSDHKPRGYEGGGRGGATAMRKGVGIHHLLEVNRLTKVKGWLYRVRLRPTAGL